MTWIATVGIDDIHGGAMTLPRVAIAAARLAMYAIWFGPYKRRGMAGLGQYLTCHINVYVAYSHVCDMRVAWHCHGLTWLRRDIAMEGCLCGLVDGMA